MQNYRFVLERYKGVSSRYTCTECKKLKIFVQYVDTEQSVIFPPYVGRCNRENKCGYHYTPKDYFRDSNYNIDNDIVFPNVVDRLIKKKSVDIISFEVWQKSLKHYSSNNLYTYLGILFGENRTKDIAKRYHLGTASHWNGATIFWQVDKDNNARTGKVMLYDTFSGKRVKKPYNHITWVHTLLQSKDYQLEQCFFGEHLINEDTRKAIAVVESEKTALIASEYLPQFIWIATGGKHGCLKSRLHILNKRKVILFPDINAFEDWTKIVEQNDNMEIFSYLEMNATTEQKHEGYDIADFLIQMNTPNHILLKMEGINPALTQLISSFDLIINP